MGSKSGQASWAAIGSQGCSLLAYNSDHRLSWTPIRIAYGPPYLPTMEHDTISLCYQVTALQPPHLAMAGMSNKAELLALSE